MPFAWVDSLACRTVLTIAVYSVIILTLLTNAIYKKYESLRSEQNNIYRPSLFFSTVNYNTEFIGISYPTTSLVVVVNERKIQEKTFTYLLFSF